MINNRGNEKTVKEIEKESFCALDVLLQYLHEAK